MATKLHTILPFLILRFPVCEHLEKRRFSVKMVFGFSFGADVNIICFSRGKFDKGNHGTKNC